MLIPTHFCSLLAIYENQRAVPQTRWCNWTQPPCPFVGWGREAPVHVILGCIHLSCIRCVIFRAPRGHMCGGECNKRAGRAARTVGQRVHLANSGWSEITPDANRYGAVWASEREIPPRARSFWGVSHQPTLFARSSPRAPRQPAVGLLHRAMRQISQRPPPRLPPGKAKRWIRADGFIFIYLFIYLSASGCACARALV